MKAAFRQVMVDWFGVGELRERLQNLEAGFHEMHGRSTANQHNTVQWINYLHHQQSSLQQQQSRQRPLSEEQVRTIVEKHAAIDILLARIRGIEERITGMVSPVRAEVIERQVEAAVQRTVAQAKHDLLKAEQQFGSTRDEVLGQLRRIAERVDVLEAGRPAHSAALASARAPEPSAEEPFTSLQHRLLKRIAKHPKHVVKSAILTLIQKYGQMQGTELREMVVEEQTLCSKSSFYRLLEELEKDGAIEVLGDGKEKTYADAMKLKKQA